MKHFKLAVIISFYNDFVPCYFNKLKEVWTVIKYFNPDVPQFSPTSLAMLCSTNVSDHNKNFYVSNHNDFHISFIMQALKLVIG
jgi:hypothetical protein